jgi:hypothetical protein
MAQTTGKEGQALSSARHVPLTLHMTATWPPVSAEWAGVTSKQLWTAQREYRGRGGLDKQVPTHSSMIPGCHLWEWDLRCVYTATWSQHAPEKTKTIFIFNCRVQFWQDNWVLLELRNICITF